MSIIINDLDNLLIDFCDLESDFFNLMRVNKHYYKLIKNNELFMEWNKCYTASPMSYIRNNKDKLFLKSCDIGLLLFSKYLVSKHNINIHYNREHPFQLSCRSGYLDIAKWLIDLSSKPGSTLINIHTDDEYAFKLYLLLWLP